MTSEHEHRPEDDRWGGSPRPAEFWESFYARGQVWSGRVNPALAAAAEGLEPGRSLDLACGEGADVLWLAERGWDATGIDLSEAAVARARETAAARGIGSARFLAADLEVWASDPPSVDGSAEPFDLVTLSFFHSPVELSRGRILRAAARRVAPGGRVVLVSHGGSWLRDDGLLTTPETELAALDLDPAEWDVLIAEERVRPGRGGGSHGGDVVVVARRRVEGERPSSQPTQEPASEQIGPTEPLPR